MLMLRIRAKHFPRGWSFVQGARCVPILVGVPLTGILNTQAHKAGFYLSFVFVILGRVSSSTVSARCQHVSGCLTLLSSPGAVTLFFMDCWAGRHRHRHHKYCEGREAGQAGASEAAIEPENLSQRLSGEAVTSGVLQF